MENQSLNNEAEACYKQGIHALKELKDINGAIQNFSKAIQLNPSRHDYWLGMVFCSRLCKLYDKALAYCDKAIELSPNNEICWFEKLQTLMEMNDFENSLKCVDKLVGLNPNDANFYYNKGYIHNKLFNLYKQPDSDKFHLSLMHNGKAIAALERAVELNKNFAYAYRELGFALSLQPKEDGKALWSFNKAIELGLYNDCLIFFYMGQLYFFRKEYDHAISSYDRAISIYQGANFFFFKGIALFFKGNYNDGLNNVEKAVKIEPTNQLYVDTFNGLKKIRLKYIGEKILFFSLDLLRGVLGSEVTGRK
jgi:tetratricopeptide (TPR) repeat protein